jgi:hypothetical protein
LRLIRAQVVVVMKARKDRPSFAMMAHIRRGMFRPRSAPKAAVIVLLKLAT